MSVARVFLFFSFRHDDQLYPCALVQWYSTIGDTPDNVTGMWLVRPQFEANNRPSMAVIHIDSIVRGVHLMGVCDSRQFLPEDFPFTLSLDAFRSFYVNKYADHHINELLA